MISSATSEISVECPDYGTGICRKAGCPRFLVRISKQGIDDEGNQLFGGACMLNGDTEWFDGCLQFTGQRPNETTTTDNKAKSRSKQRYRGKSCFDGIKVHQDIESDSTKHYIKIKGRDFQLARTIDWTIADRMLHAVQDKETDYVIDLSAEEYNGLSKACKDFVAYCLDRQELEHPVRGQKYTGKARIKPNLLPSKHV